MLKLIGFVCASMLAFPLLRPQRDAFSKYTSVEAYEIRPGVLIMPRYSNNGQACEIAIEKSHYTSTAIDLDSTLPREEFIRIMDELAPANERGRVAIDFNEDYMSLYNGSSVTTFKEYENISMKIYGKVSPKGGVSDVAATVSWKNRECANVTKTN